jgi:hypothetical protein
VDRIIGFLCFCQKYLIYIYVNDFDEITSMQAKIHLALYTQFGIAFKYESSRHFNHASLLAALEARAPDRRTPRSRRLASDDVKLSSHSVSSGCSG